MPSSPRNAYVLAGVAAAGLLLFLFRGKAMDAAKMLAALRAVMPSLGAAKSALYAPALARAMAEGGINTPARIAAFLAQLAHESGELRFMEEIWGPTSQQLRYEGTELAKRLGNTEPGDGLRYKGRGPIQLTGRANYRAAGKALGLPLEEQPKLAAEPEVGFRIAVWYWRTRGINALADAGDFVAVTKAINGGTYGLEHREKFHDRARAHLGIA